MGRNFVLIQCSGFLINLLLLGLPGILPGTQQSHTCCRLLWIRELVTSSGDSVYPGIPSTGGIHICQPGWAERRCAVPCSCLLSRWCKDFQVFQSLEMLPILSGKPSAFMPELLEFRFPLLITHLGASFEILCVILDNSQNGESKVGQMLRRGMLVGFCSMRLKDFCLIKHNKTSVERGCDHLWIYQERCQCHAGAKYPLAIQVCELYWHKNKWVLMRNKPIYTGEEKKCFNGQKSVISVRRWKAKILGWVKRELHCFMKSDWRGVCLQ